MFAAKWWTWRRQMQDSSERGRRKRRRRWLPWLEALEERSVPTNVSGHIASDTTWSGTINVVGNVTVDHGATLTVQAGTLIAVNQFGNIGITVDGTMNASGTAASPIIFTSARDPIVGGAGAGKDEW